MIWLAVSYSSEEEGDDAVTALVPACCVWSASGLNLQPARGAACAAILSRVAGVRNMRISVCVCGTSYLSKPAGQSITLTHLHIRSPSICMLSSSYQHM